MLTGFGVKAQTLDTLWMRKFSEYGGCNYVKFIENDSKVIAGTPSGRVFVLNSENGSIIDTIDAIFRRDNGNPAYFYDYVNIQNKNLLLCASADSVIIFNLNTKSIEKVLKDSILRINQYQRKIITNGRFSISTNQLAVTYRLLNDVWPDSGAKHAIIIYSLTDYSQQKVLFINRGGYPTGVVFSEENNIIAVYSNNYTHQNYSGSDLRIELYDSFTFELIRTIKLNSAFQNIMIFSPDGNKIASACEDNKLRIYDVSSGQITDEVESGFIAFQGEQNALAFTSDGAKLIYGTGDDGQRLSIYNLITKERKKYNLPGTLVSPNVLSINSNDSKLICGTGARSYMLNLSPILIVETVKTEPETTLYPNPTNGNIVFELSEINSITGYTIFDASGRKINESFRNELILTEKKLILNCSDLQAGIYYLIINWSDKSKTNKIIKEK